MSHVSMEQALADFDRHVAEMRARIAAGQCAASWGEEASEGMTVRVTVDGKLLAEQVLRQFAHKGPE